MEPTYGYCHCGCGEKTNLATITNNARGVKKGEPVRFRPYHRTRLPNNKPRWRVEDRGYDTPCWIWQLTTLPSGYGFWTGADRNTTAHKAIYEDRVGAVPKGMELDHLCRVRACVNPDHLEPVTRQENVQRSLSARGY